MGNQNPRVRVQGEPADISEAQLGGYFSKFGQVENVSYVISKTSIATGDFLLQVKISRKNI